MVHCPHHLVRLLHTRAQTLRVYVTRHCPLHLYLAWTGLCRAIYKDYAVDVLLTVSHRPLVSSRGFYAPFCRLRLRVTPFWQVCLQLPDPVVGGIGSIISEKFQPYVQTLEFWTWLNTFLVYPNFCQKCFWGRILSGLCPNPQMFLGPYTFWALSQPPKYSSLSPQKSGSGSAT